MNEFLSDIVYGWSIEELNKYIDAMETRQKDIYALLKELKSIRKQKMARKYPDNGTRGGL